MITIDCASKEFNVRTEFSDLEREIAFLNHKILKNACTDFDHFDHPLFFFNSQGINNKQINQEYYHEAKALINKNIDSFFYITGAAIFLLDFWNEIIPADIFFYGGAKTKTQLKNFFEIRDIILSDNESFALCHLYNKTIIDFAIKENSRLQIVLDEKKDFPISDKEALLFLNAIANDLISMQTKKIDALSLYSIGLENRVAIYKAWFEEFNNSIHRKIEKNINKINFLFKSATGNSNSFFKKIYYLFSKNGRYRISQNLIKIVTYPFKKKKTAKLIDYQKWSLQKKTTDQDLLKIKELMNFFSEQPSISVIMIAADDTAVLKTLKSITDQIYLKWELVLLSYEEPSALLREEIAKNPAIQQYILPFSPNNALAFNKGLSLINGQYCLMVEQGDILSSDAFFEVAASHNQNENISFIYSNHDFIKENIDYYRPSFKYSWCPDTFLSYNYIDDTVIFKTQRLKEINGADTLYPNVFLYDMMLKLSDKKNSIIFINKMLFHKKEKKVSDNKVCFLLEMKQIIETDLQRKNINGEAQITPYGNMAVRYKISQNSKVSIIIPTRDKSEILATCLESIFSRSSYQNFEIIIVDNGSAETAFFDLVEQWTKKEPIRFKCISHNIPFNFSALMNFGAEISSGDYLLLLNNDTEVISTDWIEAMLEHCQRKDIGVVGAKLLFYNNFVQHVGVVLGIDGPASHIYFGEHKDISLYDEQINQIRNYSAVTAACFMVRREVFDSVGGFDEKLAVDFNDVDFCLKVKQAGYHNLYTPYACLYHYESLSRGNPLATRKGMENHMNDVAVFISKWNNYIENDPCYSRGMY